MTHPNIRVFFTYLRGLGFLGLGQTAPPLGPLAQRELRVGKAPLGDGGLLGASPQAVIGGLHSQAVILKVLIQQKRILRFLGFYFVLNDDSIPTLYLKEKTFDNSSSALYLK